MNGRGVVLVLEKKVDAAVRGRIVVSEREFENSEAAYNAQGQSLEGSPR
jgi:hypothetical protein